MRNIGLTFARITPSIRRVFSTSQCCYEAIRSLKTPKCIALVHKETKDPIWRLLDALRHPRHRLNLSSALHENGVPTDVYERWKPVLHKSNLTDVLEESLQHPPSWVILYLISSKIRSLEHAHGHMMDLVYSHLQVASRETHGPLIFLAAIQLARFNLVVPLRSLTETFLGTWIEDPSIYFNLMLQVISCIPNRTVESANIAVLLLKSMESRQLALTSDTYEALLNDRFVTLQLTKYLQTRMTQQGFIPQTAHLEAYLRFFAKDGAIHDAHHYHQEISMRETLPDATTMLVDPSSAPGVRATTTVLGAHPSVNSAFNFLRALKASALLPGTIVPSRAKIRPLARLARTEYSSIYDFTAALCVVARDLKYNPFHLIKTFDRVPSGRPTVVTYTILIRGLLLRGDTANAVHYWNHLLKSGLTVDSEALATGVVALTRAGRPYDAFTLLEKFASFPDNSASVYLRKPVKVTPKTINDFMVALNRIQRPDVVFRLWDNMQKLYEVSPDSISLSILLQSARLARKLDDSLSGAIAQLSLKNPFRRRGTTRGPPTREQAVDEIRRFLYDPKTKQTVGYKSGIWRERLPAPAVRQVFLQAFFGMAQSQGKYEEMLAAESPASATRPSFDSDPATLGLPKLGPVKYKFEPFPDLLPANALTAARTHYPTITVTNKNCLDYISLLGLDERAAEIPLVLAWMKLLGLQPSESILGLSLALWSEVSVQAPLVERWQGGPEKGEYAKLVKWIKNWVGEGRSPSEQILGKWARIVVAMREKR